MDYDYEMSEKELLSSRQKNHLVAFIDRRNRSFSGRNRSFSDNLSFAIWNGEDNYSKGEKLNKFVNAKLCNSEIVMIADNRKYVELKSDLVASHSNTVLIIVKKKMNKDGYQQSHYLTKNPLMKKLKKLILIFQAQQLVS